MINFRSRVRTYFGFVASVVSFQQLIIQVSNASATGQQDMFSKSTSAMTGLSWRQVVPAAGLCRHRFGYDFEPDFQLQTCAACYHYLFPHMNLSENWRLSAQPPSAGVSFDNRTSNDENVSDSYVNLSSGSSKPRYTDSLRRRKRDKPPPASVTMVADIHNETWYNLICQTLDSTEDCHRWRDCCLSAEKCCHRQLEIVAIDTARTDATAAGQSWKGQGQRHGQCPMTWDGYLCWDSAEVDTEVSATCPGFLPFATKSGKAFKSCTSNGSWYVEPEKQLEWTDYTMCFDVQHIETSVIVSLTFNALGLVFLLPAIAIFIRYRPLRIQKRIQLHIHLLASFTLYAVVYIVWDVVIVLDRIYQPNYELTNIHANTVGCRLLYALTRYARSVNYMWMFCEALYLHWLIVKAFEAPKSLTWFLLIAWGFPAIPVIIYSISRIYLANERCWIDNNGAWEWLIYGPNLAALALNFIILLNILRILMTRLQAMPNDPRINKYRRAVKATFILSPLFGVQFLLIIYRPSHETDIGRHYDAVSAFMSNSQGIFVSLVFCYLNAEVLSYLKRSYNRIKQRRGKGRRTSMNDGGARAWPAGHAAVPYTIDTQSETDCLQQSTAGARKNSLRKPSLMGGVAVPMVVLGNGYGRRRSSDSVRATANAAATDDVRQAAGPSHSSAVTSTAATAAAAVNDVHDDVTDDIVTSLIDSADIELDNASAMNTSWTEGATHGSSVRR